MQTNLSFLYKPKGWVVLRLRRGGSGWYYANRNSTQVWFPSREEAEKAVEEEREQDLINPLIKLPTFYKIVNIGEYDEDWL